MTDESRNVSVAFLRNKLADEKRKNLKSGGGDGTFDGMDARIKRLEDDFREIKGDLKTLVKDVAEIKGKVSALPTTLQLIGFVLAVLAIAGLAKYFAP
ncbi:hypothetical protein ACLIR7_03665 [Nitratireductor aquimarinus]|uniref:hypothetical protein n=1 Tax=Nitratireductor aquimarinus TaxID=889300 RepID=UPI00398F7C20